MGDALICPLCGHVVDFAQNTDRTFGPGTYYECEICGRFILTFPSYLSLNNLGFDKAIISAYTKEHTESGDPIVIFSGEPQSQPEYRWTTYERIRSWFPSDVNVRLERALNLLGKRSKFPGDKVEIGHSDYPLFYVDSQEHWLTIMSFMFQTLIDAGYVSGRTVFPSEFVVTAKGWSHIMELAHNRKDSKQAFVAMWFDSQMESAYENGLSKAIKEAGYNPLKINDKEHNDKIDDQIIAEIRRSRFVVCDFTGHRGGVYFEAGFAMGLSIPIIWTCRENDMQPHFDTRQYNHIVWTNEENLYEKLLHRIKATIV